MVADLLNFRIFRILVNSRKFHQNYIRVQVFLSLMFHFFFFFFSRNRRRLVSHKWSFRSSRLSREDRNSTCHRLVARTSPSMSFYFFSLFFLLDRTWRPRFCKNENLRIWPVCASFVPRFGSFDRKSTGTF